MVELVKERIKVIINTEKRDLEFEREIQEFFIKTKKYRTTAIDWSNLNETILYFSKD